MPYRRIYKAAVCQGAGDTVESRASRGKTEDVYSNPEW